MISVPKQSLSTARSPLAPAREWQPVAGFTWELFLIALAWVIAFSTIPLIILRVSRGAYPSTLLWLVFWLYFALTYKLTAWLSDKYRVRQRRILIGAQELLEGDTRAPVLYLRAFKDDETTSRLLNLSTEEQELAVTMREIGPFIAFGEPGEVSPEPGAARMYVPQDNWQGAVANLMASARLVVGRIANSEGFLVGDVDGGATRKTGELVAVAA